MIGDIKETFITYGNNKAFPDNKYTQKQIAEAVGISVATVHNIIVKLNIKACDKFFNKRTGKNQDVYSYDDMTLIRRFVADQEEKKRKVQQNMSDRVNGVEEIVRFEKASDHPLVTDKRCLDFNYWPDTTPICFAELD